MSVSAYVWECGSIIDEVRFIIFSRGGAAFLDPLLFTTAS